MDLSKEEGKKEEKEEKEEYYLPTKETESERIERHKKLKQEIERVRKRLAQIEAGYDYLYRTRHGIPEDELVVLEEQEKQDKLLKEQEEALAREKKEEEEEDRPELDPEFLEQYKEELAILDDGEVKQSAEEVLESTYDKKSIRQKTLEDRILDFEAMVFPEQFQKERAYELAKVQRQERLIRELKTGDYFRREEEAIQNHQHFLSIDPEDNVMREPYAFEEPMVNWSRWTYEWFSQWKDKQQEQKELETGLYPRFHYERTGHEVEFPSLLNDYLLFIAMAYFSTTFVAGTWKNMKRSFRIQPYGNPFPYFSVYRIHKWKKTYQRYGWKRGFRSLKLATGFLLLRWVYCYIFGYTYSHPIPNEFTLGFFGCVLLGRKLVKFKRIAPFNSRLLSYPLGALIGAFTGTFYSINIVGYETATKYSYFSKFYQLIQPINKGYENIAKKFGVETNPEKVHETFKEREMERWRATRPKALQDKEMEILSQQSKLSTQ